MLVTTAAVEDVRGVAQLYRDREDAEYVFDEMKSQWGWIGFMAKDMARTNALISIGAVCVRAW